MSESETESEVKVMIDELDTMTEGLYRIHRELEQRVIALERALEAVLRRLETSTSPDDEPGWFGVTE